MKAPLILLVCGDHMMYLDASGTCLLDDLPFPVVVLASRKSEVALRQAGSQVEIVRASWSDLDSVRQVIRHLADTCGLLGVATVNEGFVDLAAQLREEFGLPGLGGDVALAFRNKLEMKRLAALAGLRVPRYVSCTQRAEVEALLQTCGKIVIKPVDGLGSRHVSIVTTAQELAAWFEAQPDITRYEDIARFEAEEFINGDMYHVNCIVRDGETVFDASARYVPGMASIDYTRGQPLVTVMLPPGELAQRLRAFSDNVTRALGLQDGVTHLECFLTEDGSIVLCEVAARAAGGGIVQMIEAQTGVNIVRASLIIDADAALHLPDQVAGYGRVHGLMGYRCRKGGRLLRVPSSSDFGEDWVTKATMYAEPGGFARAAKQSSDFLSLIIFHAADHAEFHARQHRLLQRFVAGLQFADGELV